LPAVKLMEKLIANVKVEIEPDFPQQSFYL